ncbi:GNAT family N-acetyltransferase [Flavobacterium sp. N3904]|uniref:GNAT family N-acetyltransferase n=1 Tax=Flavobacterium sp. N3904 TaxID=2986835 RepID=UPI002223FC57|nr:GNAT family protein [Flavobacterium sp. N3904]
MIKFETLETNRLILRKITPEIIGYMFDNYSDNKIKKYLGLVDEDEFTLEKMKREGGYKTYNRTILSFLIVLKSNNEIIGRCGYHNWYNDHRRAELGYSLSKDENKKKGYMSEAVISILEYGFNCMDLNRIEAYISPLNIASQSIVKKNGFVQEGILKEHFIENGIVHDSLVFSLLKEYYK